MRKPIVLRRRYIPNEIVDISDDELLFRSDDLLITRWTAIKPRPDFYGGISFAFLDRGYKLGRFYDRNGQFLYWYCDIIEVVYDAPSDTYTMNDLLLDIKIFPDGRVMLLDAEELAQAIEDGLITNDQACMSLRTLDGLLKMIYDGKFPPAECEGWTYMILHDQKYVDLHTHTTLSDGSMTPEELVRYAFGKGLAAVAVTDHDTVSGVSRALEEGDKLGIEVIAGVEISVDFSTEMHLLGYFPNGYSESILKILEDLRVRRELRNPRIVNKLNELGFDISMEEVNGTAGGGNVGRPHIARVLQEKGYVESMNEAFEKYLGVGGPAYFKKEKLLPKEGIAEIIGAGGIPVLAHPIFIGLTYDRLDHLVGELESYGLKGIEVFYSWHSQEQTSELLKIAEKHGLLTTGGSDFHGSFKSDIEIGIGTGTLKVPYSLLEALRQID